MGKGTVTALRTSFSNATDNSDEMHNCLGSLFFNDKYLTMKQLALTDVFGIRISEEAWEWVSSTRCEAAAVPFNTIFKECQVCSYASEKQGI